MHTSTLKQTHKAIGRYTFKRKTFNTATRRSTGEGGGLAFLALFCLREELCESVATEELLSPESLEWQEVVSGFPLLNTFPKSLGNFLVGFGS